MDGLINVLKLVRRYGTCTDEAKLTAAVNDLDSLSRLQNQRINGIVSCINGSNAFDSCTAAFPQQVLLVVSFFATFKTLRRTAFTVSSVTQSSAFDFGMAKSVET